MSERIFEPLVMNFSLGSEQRIALDHYQIEMNDFHPISYQSVLIALPATVDENKLQMALNQVIHRHEALRLLFGQMTSHRGWRQQVNITPPCVQWSQLNFDNQSLLGRDELLAAWFSDTQIVESSDTNNDLIYAAIITYGNQQKSLALAISPLIVDGGSLHVIAQEIMAVYEGIVLTAVDELFQYSQYLEWRQELEEDNALDLAYWNEYLAKQNMLAPRLSYRSNASQAGLKQSLGSEFDPRSLAQAEALAAQIGVGIDVVLQAAWWVLIARISGQHQFIASSVHDCRGDYEVMAGSVGVFEKALPLLIDIDFDASFESWCRRLAGILATHIEAQEAWNAQALSDKNYLKIGFVASLIPPAATCVFQYAPDSTGYFELALQIDLAQTQFGVSFNTAYYSPDAIEVLLQQYATVLNRAFDLPSLQLLAVVGEKERAAILSLNREPIDFGSELLLARIVAWAERKPTAIAIRSDSETLNYAQLVSKINRLAHWMISHGIQQGDLIALELPRSSDFVVAMLAAWQAGAAYLPVDPEWPEHRRSAILADAKPALLLRVGTDEISAATAWRVEQFNEIDASQFLDTSLNIEYAANDIAYVLYTSGSTGTPKGVVIEQSQLLNYVMAASQAMRLDSVKCWALTSSVAADLGNTALFGALLNGACLAIASANDMQDGASFTQFMSAHQVDGLKIVPSYFEALLEHETPYVPQKLIFGGEATAAPLLERIYQIAPDCDIFNHYGPTETTIGVMVHSVNCTELANLSTLPLTTVLANNHIYVLDPQMQLTPIGAMGEVYIAGEQLFRTYLSRELEPLAHTFISGERLYRTGDLAYVLPEGGIRLTGRSDHQIKIRGFRVEPAEIEAALLSEQGVHQALVMQLKNEAGEPELIAYLVADVNQEQLRSKLSVILPIHMQPTKYIFFADFPRLLNGKIDRIAIAAMPLDQEQDIEYIKHRDALDFVIADNMAILLGHERVSINGDFFELGGHSLLVIKLLARIRKILKVDLTPSTVFDAPTVIELSQVIRSNVLNETELLSHADIYVASRSEAAFIVE